MDPIYLTPVYGFLGRWMRKRSWAAFTPWHRVFIWMLPGETLQDIDPFLLVHEYTHVEQIERQQVRFGRSVGLLVAWALYLWELMLHGYGQNKYELEAYAREHAARLGGHTATLP